MKEPIICKTALEAEETAKNIAEKYGEILIIKEFPNYKIYWSKEKVEELFENSSQPNLSDKHHDIPGNCNGQNGSWLMADYNPLDNNNHIHGQPGSPW